MPFCSAICPYCDFAVRRGTSGDGTAFVDDLIHEIDGLRSARLRPEAPDLAEAIDDLVAGTFDTLYLGGGTPSLLASDDLERLLDGLRRHVRLSDDLRLFLEANPEDVDAQRVAAWRRLGVETLSLGVQSFDRQALTFLGRRHTPKQATRAVALARDAGFSTVSVDLIYGRPEDDPDTWRRELDQALGSAALGSSASGSDSNHRPDHLSLYELEIHPRTAFGKRQARGELDVLDQDLRAELFRLTHDHLADAGFDGYEVSNFARHLRHRSRHNGKYWRHVPYLGLGPSAHSYIGEWRFWNERALPAWRRWLHADTSPIAGWERLPATTLALESAMLGLRTRDGLDLEAIKERWGVDLWASNSSLIRGWEQRGWLDVQDRRLLPRIGGMARADALAAELEVSAVETAETAVTQ